MKFARGMLLLTLWLLGGCGNFLAQRMVAPPNGRKAQEGFDQKVDANETLVSVGPPQAMLAIWVLEPETPARGTVLVLHGFVADHHQVKGAAKALQKAGYRAVLVDLRGHGKSAADHITYGVEDARDLARLTDYLQQKNLCGKSVGVYGISYGAASGILFAGSDPRVKAVVAVAPFASLREEAPYFGKHVLPVPGRFMTSADYSAVIDRMGKDAGFDPDASNPVAAIRKTQAQVRLFHGTADMIVPSTASEELMNAAPGHSELTLFPGKGHLALCLDWFGDLHPQTQAWFDRYLAETPPVTANR